MTIAKTYSLALTDVQTELETQLAIVFKSTMPVAIRKDGLVLVCKNGKIGCISPGSKNIQKAIVAMDEKLRQRSFQNKQSSLYKKEPVGYGKITKQLPSGIFEVQLYEGIERGIPISQKILKGFFDYKKRGIKGESYEVGRNYLFEKISKRKNGFDLARKKERIVRFEVERIAKKITKSVKKNLYIEVILVDLTAQILYTKHLKSQSHLIDFLSKKVKEKTNFELKSNPKV